MVVLTKDKTRLTWVELEKFISQNLAEILKSFWWVDLTKIPNPRITQFKELSEKFAKLMEKTKFSWKEVPVYKKLFSELTLPGRSIAQIIDTFVNSTDKWSDLVKILLLWDRAKSFTKISDYKRLAVSAGLSSSIIIWDDKLDTNDAIELLLYNTMWLIVWAVADYYIKD
jgi:hypothetical protein